MFAWIKAGEVLRDLTHLNPAKHAKHIVSICQVSFETVLQILTTGTNTEVCSIILV